jgi:hypothetical protein
MAASTSTAAAGFVALTTSGSTTAAVSTISISLLPFPLPKGFLCYDLRSSPVDDSSSLVPTFLRSGAAFTPFTSMSSSESSSAIVLPTGLGGRPFKTSGECGGVGLPK